MRTFRKYTTIFTMLGLVILLAYSNAYSYDEALLVGRTPLGYEKITVTTTAVSRLDATLRASAGAVFITIELNNIRYRIDGGNPDVDDGHPVSEASNQNLYFIDPSSIRNLRMISVVGNARVIITYYKR